MRLLVLGDFHGEFPKKIVKVIKQKRIDLVVSNGDYLPFKYRELWFEHCYDKACELWEAIGKKKYKKFIIEDLNAGEKVIQRLNKLPVPVITVLGNVDWPEANDVADPEFIKKYRAKEKWNFEEGRKEYFSKIVGKYKNIHLINYSDFTYQGLIFIGARTHSFPGLVKSKVFRKSKRIIAKLFEKHKMKNKLGKVVFVSHNVPYNTKLDKVTSKEAHSNVKNKHYGSKLSRRVIEQCKPVLHIGGHIHEGRGMQKIGKTLCVNPGSLYEGKYAIVEMDEKGKIRVKFR